MRRHTPWARFASISATLIASLAACDSVLDIEDPKMRSDAGAAGEATNGAAENGGAPNGEAGSDGRLVPVGGAGQAGEASLGGAAAGGEAGASVECDPKAVRCGGEAERLPEICDETGRWIANPAQSNGDCDVACSAGKCTECRELDRRCSTCADGDPNCNQRVPQTCVDGKWANAKSPCEHYCSSGECKTPTSCLENNANTCEGVSCCQSLWVPGGDYKRDYDGGYYNDDRFSAHVSEFLLDKFEVTVGRMQAFVARYDDLRLEEGAGKAANVADDPGWSHALPLPDSKEELIATLKCPDTTWPDDFSDELHLPVNCVDHDVAYAFCIWDGGRLPTEAEWNFAATGGSEQRVYPWKAPLSGPPVSDQYALFYPPERTLPTTVGSFPRGDGRWGQSDLAGNVQEWVLDFYADYSTDECVNCANLLIGSNRVYRGGSFLSGAETITASQRVDDDPRLTTSSVGFRCARDLK